MKIRPAGLEPATPCLEVRFWQNQKSRFLRETEPSHSSSCGRLAEVC